MDVLKLVGKLLAGLLLILTCVINTSHAVTVDKIIAFGDSLSDNGNLYAFTQRTHKVLPFIPVVPASPPYFEGRFSNGENWLDVISKETGLPLIDHAYGGAWAEPIWQSAQLVPFDIHDQVSLYIMENALDRHKDRHLFILWAGANDYLNGREDIDFATTNAVNNIKAQIERLIYHGARQFLVIGLPDISQTPKVIGEGPIVVEQVRQLVDQHNRKLTEMIKEEQEKNLEVTMVLVDAKQPFDAMYNNPAAYQLKNVKEACYGGDFYRMRELIDQNEINAAKEMKIDIMNNPSLQTAYITGKLAQYGNDACSNPDEYLFWDQMHPTRIIHHVIATLAILELNTHNINWISSQNKN